MDEEEKGLSPYSGGTGTTRRQKDYGSVPKLLQEAFGETLEFCIIYDTFPLGTLSTTIINMEVFFIFTRHETAQQMPMATVSSPFLQGPQ